MSVTRDLKFDGLKFIMIFFVVLAHIGFNDYGLGVGRMIYAFHMPVFIFLSGYFTSLNSNIEKQNKWIIKTFLIYVIAQAAYLLLRVLISYEYSVKTSSPFDLYSIISWRNLIYPEFALWYLVSLIYWRIAIWRLFPKVDDIKLFAISIVLALLSGFVPIDHDFSFQRAFAFFPFFVLGIMFKKRNLIGQLERIPMAGAIVALLVGLVIARYVPKYIPRYHYEIWQQLIWRFIQTGLAIYLCLLIVRVSRVKFVEKFARFGEHTLWIYIGHIYMLAIGNVVFYCMGCKFNNFLALLFTTICCVTLILFAEFVKWCKKSKLK